jgi:thiol-disulfide isomerase/thioredoxin
MHGDACRFPFTKSAIVIVFAVFLVTLTVASESSAPNFAFYRHDGARHVFYQILDSLPEGGMALLNFTSVTCKPCKKEIPELKGITDFAGGRLRLLCVYSEQGDEVRACAAELKVLEHAFVDPMGTVRKSFGVEKIPTTIIVGKDRTVLGRFVGYTPENIELIRAIAGIQ